MQNQQNLMSQNPSHNTRKCIHRKNSLLKKYRICKILCKYGIFCFCTLCTVTKSDNVCYTLASANVHVTFLIIYYFKMKTITMLAVGILMMYPAMVSAEETTSGADGSATPPATESLGESSSEGSSAGEGEMRRRQMLRESPTKPSIGNLRESPTRQNLIAPRDSASGQATGKRMMASGTRPLPPKMEERMEKRDERREQMMASGTAAMERREERKEGREDRRDERQDRRQDRREEILKRMATQMVTVMEAAIDRFTKLADRLDSRIAKLKEKGVNTATAEANLAIARTKITEATTAVALAKGNIASAVATAASSTTGDAGKPVRESLQKARESVDAARKALLTAVASLKANSKSEMKPATTTSVTP
jgi:phosphoglycolate phosphatase-like HAD superfamily hydrolase